MTTSSAAPKFVAILPGNIYSIYHGKKRLQSYIISEHLTAEWIEWLRVTPLLEIQQTLKLE